MYFEINAFLPNQQELLKEQGLDENGRVQKVVDVEFIHYMRLKMPMDTAEMIANTRNIEAGVVVVDTPYAHYMNEGIKYVDPITGKSAFYNENYGFWSRPGTKKMPSSEPLKYHGGADRGAHFVERTVSENFDDILKAAQREMNKHD